MKEKAWKKPFHTMVTKENKEFLSKWRGASLHTTNLVGVCEWKTYPAKFEIGHNSRNIPKGNSYTFGEEVSFEEFKRLISTTKKKLYLN